jgi:hypothetical protein
VIYVEGTYATTGQRSHWRVKARDHADACRILRWTDPDFVPDPLVPEDIEDYRAEAAAEAYEERWGERGTVGGGRV